MTELLGPNPRVSDSVDLGWGWEICISKFPGVAVKLVQGSYFENYHSIFFPLKKVLLSCFS